MVDTDTFLTTLYIMVDECCQSHLPPEVHPGPQASLSRSAVVTLGLLGSGPASQANVRSIATPHSLGAPPFPCYPIAPSSIACSAVTMRPWWRASCTGWTAWRAATGSTTLWTAQRAEPGCQTSGRWLAAGPGRHRLEQPPRLVRGLPPAHRRQSTGGITGLGFGSASAKDQPWAETFFALRQQPHLGGLSVGKPALCPYVSEKGFEGQAAHAPWWQGYGAQVMCPPKRTSQQPSSQRRRRWLAGVRQIVETVDDKRHHTFGLSRERPHDLTGFQARLAAKLAVHTYCIWLNEQLGRPSLAFADLVNW
jgi:hypothetical protein